MRNLCDAFGVVSSQIKKWYKCDFAKALMITLTIVVFYLICLFVFPSLAFRSSSGIGIILPGVLLVLVYRGICQSTDIPAKYREDVEKKQAVTVLAVCVGILFAVFAAVRLIQADIFPEFRSLANTSILASAVTAFFGMTFLVAGTRYMVCWIMCSMWLFVDNLVGPVISNDLFPERTIVGYVLERAGLIVQNGAAATACGFCLVIAGGIVSRLILSKIYDKKEQPVFKNLMSKNKNI